MPGFLWSRGVSLSKTFAVLDARAVTMLTTPLRSRSPMHVQRFLLSCRQYPCEDRVDEFEINISKPARQIESTQIDWRGVTNVGPQDIKLLELGQQLLPSRRKMFILVRPFFNEIVFNPCQYFVDQCGRKFVYVEK